MFAWWIAASYDKLKATKTSVYLHIYSLKSNADAFEALETSIINNLARIILDKNNHLRACYWKRSHHHKNDITVFSD